MYVVVSAGDSSMEPFRLTAPMPLIVHAEALLDSHLSITFSPLVMVAVDDEIDAVVLLQT